MPFSDLDHGREAGWRPTTVPKRSATDDHQFGRLKQDRQVAVLHQVAADDGADDDDNSDDDKHRLRKLIAGMARGLSSNCLIDVRARWMRYRNCTSPPSRTAECFWKAAEDSGKSVR